LSKISRYIADRPVAVLCAVTLLVGLFCTQIPKFKLDASADSLVLENDAALRYYRQVASRYSSSDYLVITYSPKADLFSDTSLADLKSITAELAALDGIESVTSILNVPLLFSPPVSIGDLSEGIKTLESPGVDMALAKKEFQENPLYSKQLLSPDGETTAILATLPRDEPLRKLLARRTALRVKKYGGGITRDEERELDDVSQRYRRRATELTRRQNAVVAKIRAIMDRHRDRARMYLGGVPMIVADMISFIRNDIIVFGVGVLAFLVITLAVIFRRPRWIVIPMLCCFAAALFMLGFLGFMDWRVTVISSNFISLMLIITMSLTIHLIVRYRELCALMPAADQKTLVAETLRLKFVPCLYTTLTTIVAFVSLLVSAIRPVMDFGLMMTIGLIASFVLTFLLFPALAMLVGRDTVGTGDGHDTPFTLKFAHATHRFGTPILLTGVILAVVSGYGISKLVVENRFIDYFREKTEIHQGMKLIDQKLGGTTPLDVIIDFKDDPLAAAETDDPMAEALLDDNALDGGGDEVDALLDDFGDEEDAAKAPSKESAWFTSYRMEKIGRIHDFLDSLPETGKVQSVADLIDIATRLNDGIAMDDYELAIVYDKLPAKIKDVLVNPYVSVADNQTRLTMRVMETSRNLSRRDLLRKIHDFLTGTMGLAPDQIHFTNMLVLYNNMLQSLFASQIKTIGVVFLGIMVMFMILFRSLTVALIAIIPNLLPAAMVLGGMGLFGIPLDMMTITIAAITIGIAVDDTIHYIHRFEKEFAKDRSYVQAMYRSHASIGKAMYYTSVTIIIGFSILMMSNFIPTIYFGLFTGFAMLAALLAALTLLPKLILLVKPFGPEGDMLA